MKKKPAGRLLRELREKVDQLPPDRAKALNDTLARDAAAQNLVEQLRQAVRDSGETHYQLGKRSGIATAQIDRFMRGERDLRFETACRLCAVLGLKFTNR